MTDAELLRLAALAVGLNHHGWSDYHLGLSYDLVGYMLHWRPQYDLSQALALAAHLDIAIESRQDTGTTTCCWMVSDDAEIKFMQVVEPHNGNPWAATCRAIVRAAAEIGKSLEAQDGD